MTRRKKKRSNPTRAVAPRRSPEPKANRKSTRRGVNATLSLIIAAGLAYLLFMPLDYRNPHARLARAPASRRRRYRR